MAQVFTLGNPDPMPISYCNTKSTNEHFTQGWRELVSPTRHPEKDPGWVWSTASANDDDGYGGE